jgi:uncharacterized protein (DUF305 family)
MIRTKRALALPALFLAAAVGLGACSDSGDAAPQASSAAFVAKPATGPHNQADVEYGVKMFPHRVQTLQLADLALARTKNDKVKAIANQAKDGTSKEVATFGAYLTGWKTAVPSGTDSHSGGAAGTLSQQEITQLESAPEAQFDKLWLQAMIKHTQGAVKESQGVLSSGQNGDNKQLAESIVTKESQEIKTLQDTLGSI